MLSSHINWAVLKYLPSKKFIIVALGVAVLVFVVWQVFFVKKTGDNLAVVSQKNTEKQAQLEKLNTDDDNDGLKNWEELLWKTDPNNPDTDGDGTKDNDEILTKRDPRKAGPDDEILKLPTTAADASLAIASSTEPNLTAELAQNFTNSYFIRKIASASNDNAPIDKNTLQNQIFTNIASTIVNKDAIDRTPRYMEKDFKITRETSANSARVYINALGTLFHNASFPEKNEMEIISEITSNQDQNIENQSLEGLQDLPLYTEAYQKLAEDMKTIPIPENFLEVHIRMADNFWRLGEYLEKLSGFETDPVKGVMAIAGYSQESAQARELLKVIISEIKAQNMTFSTQEGGAEFNKYVSI